MPLFYPGIDRALDQILANQAWMKNAIFIINQKVTAIMANTEELETAMTELEEAANKAVVAIEGFIAKGGNNQEQVDALTGRITAVTDKLNNVVPTVNPLKK